MYFSNSWQTYETKPFVINSNTDLNIIQDSPKLELNKEQKNLPEGWVEIGGEWESESQIPRKFIIKVVYDSESPNAFRNFYIYSQGEQTFNAVLQIWNGVEKILICSVHESLAIKRVSLKKMGKFNILMKVLKALFSNNIYLNFRKKAFYLKRYGLVGLKKFAQDILINGDLSYRGWIDAFETPYLQNSYYFSTKIKSFTFKPKISVIMPVYNTPLKMLEESIKSVIEQFYDNWELCIADDASTDFRVVNLLKKYEKKDSRIKVVYRLKNGYISSASNDALNKATGEYVALMDHDDTLSPNALFEIVDNINRNPNLKFIYSDEDKLDIRSNRLMPTFKPDWSPNLLDSCNYLNHLTVIEKMLVDSVGGWSGDFPGSDDYDLFLKCTEKLTPDEIGHIPMVLYHWRVWEKSVSASSKTAKRCFESGKRALQQSFFRRNLAVDILDVDKVWYNVRYKLPEKEPLVSIVIPTKDKLGLLKQTIDGLLYETNYQSLEIIIVNNNSEQEETIHYLNNLVKSHINIKVINNTEKFNWAYLNNLGVRESRGSIVGLLNNDLKMIHKNWLKELIGYVLRPNIGVVGPKLLYPNNTIQHAGVVIGIGGIAGHSHKGFNVHESGYAGRLVLTQNVSAVTGACLFVRKSIYEQVGGISEEFRVAFNDVDFCLKVLKAGYFNVFNPHSCLYHLESATRGSDEAPERREEFKKESKLLRERWKIHLIGDRFYNPNLTLQKEDFTLAYPPRSFDGY
ncbi:MAG: glycosyltransferase family 2 protein [Bdellovibrionales bacterium]|nr:glycosyltransferase family 2 protein [Bdellovibrionales bacterium]